MSPAGGDFLDETTPAAGVGFPCIDPFPDDPAPFNPNHGGLHVPTVRSDQAARDRACPSIEPCQRLCSPIEEAVQRLKDHRLELEAGEDQGVSKKNKQLRKITKKAVRKAFKQYWRLLFPPNFFTKEDRE
jgi:hypothetical protein